VKKFYLFSKPKISGTPWDRIYHFHNRKTGGTSLNRTFLEFDGGDSLARYKSLAQAKKNKISVGGKVFIGWNKKLIEKGNYFYAFSHIPYHYLNLPQNTFTVTCFRDPFNRLLSHYRMLKSFSKEKIQHPCMETEGNWLGNSFEDFLHLIPREHRLVQLYNFSPTLNVEEAVEAVKQINQIVFTENFSMGVSSINKKTGLSLKSLHIRQNE
jgi:hypothetical protein